MNGESGKLFKSAMSGFNKKDVLDYIEETSKKYAAERSSKEAEIGALENRLRAKEDEYAELLAEKDILTGILAERDNEKAAYLIEISELNDKVKELDKIVEEHYCLKACLTDIELNAHKRAQEIESEAVKRAAEVQGNVDRALEQAKRTLRPAVRQVHDQTDRARHIFAEMADKLDEMLKSVDLCDEAMEQVALEEIEDLTAREKDVESETVKKYPFGIGKLMQRLRAEQERVGSDAHLAAEEMPSADGEWTEAF